MDCQSAVWSAELELLAGSLLEQLNDALPEGSEVRALKFTTSGGRASFLALRERPVFRTAPDSAVLGLRMGNLGTFRPSQTDS